MTEAQMRLKNAMLGIKDPKNKEVVKEYLVQSFDDALKKLKAEAGNRALRGLFCGGDDVTA